MRQESGAVSRTVQQDVAVWQNRTGEDGAAVWWAVNVWRGVEVWHGVTYGTHAACMWRDMAWCGVPRGKLH